VCVCECQALTKYDAITQELAQGANNISLIQMDASPTISMISPPCRCGVLYTYAHAHMYSVCTHIYMYTISMIPPPCMCDVLVYICKQAHMYRCGVHSPTSLVQSDWMCMCQKSMQRVPLDTMSRGLLFFCWGKNRYV